MAVCVVASGADLSVSSTSVGSCADYVLYTAADYAALSPNLTLVDTLELSGLVVLAWALAWGVKILRRTL